MSVRKRTVLVIEDDALVARSLIRALTKHFEVLHAASLAAGMAAVRAGGFSALICDWDLGDGSGAAALILCAKLHPHVTRVVHSGRSYEDVAAQLPDGVLEVFVQKASGASAVIAALRDR